MKTMIIYGTISIICYIIVMLLSIVHITNNITIGIAGTCLIVMIIILTLVIIEFIKLVKND